MEVRDVREARPVTIETMSSSWVTELCGNGGMLVLTGVRARDRGTCRGPEFRFQTGNDLI